MRPPHLLLPLLLAGLWAATVAASSGEATPPPVENGPALKVNSQVVTIREVENVFADSFSIIQEHLRRGTLKPEMREVAIREAWKAALSTAMQDELLDQLAHKFRSDIIKNLVSRTDPSVPATRVIEFFRRIEGDYIAKLRTQLIEAAGGERELRAALARKGQTIRDWESTLSTELFRREVLFEQVGQVAPSPAAAKAYYEAHPDEFRTSDAWRLRRIKIPKSKFDSPDAAAQATVLVYKKLTDEKIEFATLAATVAFDPPFDNNGGLLTVDGQADQPSGHFLAEETIASKLKDGEFSKPYDLGDSFLIVFREGYRERKNQTYEESANHALALAYQDKVRKKKEEFLEKQLKSAYTEIIQKDPPARWLKDQ